MGFERCHLVLTRDGFRHCAAHEQSNVERGGADGDVDGRSAGDTCAIRGRGRRSVGGIDELYALRGTDSRERGLLRTVVSARWQVDPRCFHRRRQVVGIVVARKHFHPFGFGRFVVFQVAHDHEQRAVGSLCFIGCHRTDGGVGNAVGIGAFVVDSHELAHANHRLNLTFVSLPVGEEHAGRSRHRQQIGVGGECVFFQWVLFGIGATLGVVVFDEGDSVAAIGRVIVVADERPVVVVALRQTVPLSVVGGIAHGVAELEIEGCRGFSRCVDPFADGRGAVPALADAESGVGRLVVEFRVGACIAFHHVVAETHVAEVVEQHVQIGFHRVLHVLARVVEVGHTVPVFARVGSTRSTVGLHHVGSAHRVGHALVSLCREVEILACQRLAMVHHHVGDGSDAIVAERLDERTQFGLGAEG